MLVSSRKVVSRKVLCTQVSERHTKAADEVDGKVADNEYHHTQNATHGRSDNNNNNNNNKCTRLEKEAIVLTSASSSPSTSSWNASSSSHFCWRLMWEQRDKEINIDMAGSGVGGGGAGGTNESSDNNRESARRSRLLYYDDFVTLDSTVMIKVKRVLLICYFFCYF